MIARRAAIGKAAVIAAIFALVACESSPEKPSREPPAPPPRASAPAPSASASSAPAPLPTLTASAAAPGDVTGAWEARYEAKKGVVTLPPKVKDKAIAADDGKIASGPGSVEITISAAGDIRGKVTGALGALSVSGKLDGAMIRAGVSPDDPHAPNAMTGILVGAIKGDTISAELHVAGPDGSVIREASFDLKRKK